MIGNYIKAATASVFVLGGMVMQAATIIKNNSDKVAERLNYQYEKGSTEERTDTELIEIATECMDELQRRKDDKEIQKIKLTGMTAEAVLNNRKTGTVDRDLVDAWFGDH